MLCTNGHNNADDARFCSTCGINTFHPGTHAGFVSANAPRPLNGFSVASLVCSLALGWALGIGSILGLIFGLIARRQIRDRGERGDGLAIAGIIFGLVEIALFALIFILGATHHGANN